MSKEPKTAEQIARERRKYVRKKPTDYDFADIRPEKGKKDVLAMIIDESEGGCSLVIRTKHFQLEQLAKHSRWQISLGPAGAQRQMLAEIRWTNQISEDLINTGFQFIS